MTDPAAEAIAKALKMSMPAVRRLLEELEMAGVQVVHVPTTGDLCPQCVAHYATAQSGFCVKCTTENELEAQKERDDAEEARLREEAVTAVNRQKKERERFRELFDANPRKKSLGKWIEEFVADPERWDAIVAEVQAQQAQ